MTNATRIRIFDTTLRDGEQSPGATLSFQEKLEIARQLVSLGADVIEAGFPITSNGDYESVRAIAAETDGAIVTGLARCVPRDIDRAGDALKGTKGHRIHVFCATSKIHIEKKLKKPIDEIIRLAVDSVKRARQFVDDVEFSPEDGSRTELDVLVDITAAAVEAGATTVNIPDTVGYAVPEEYGRIFSYVREKLPELDRDDIYLSAHCHNDLGLAVANSLAAVENGCRQVECTINGIGERAGNASLEEIVMALRTRVDFFDRFHTRINTRKIYPLSRMVSSFTGMHVQRNKAIVGENAFAHEAGIHQDGVLKERTTYEIMDPVDVGVPSNKLVLGKHSGRHALRERIEAMGYQIDADTLDQVYGSFKRLSDKKKNVYDEDIESLVETQIDSSEEQDSWQLVSLQVTSGTNAIPTATVVLGDASGKQSTDASTGDGPIDAIYSAIQRITGVGVELLDYQIRAITQGKDAQGEVAVDVKHHDLRLRGRGVSTDVIEASAKAYLSAINRIRNVSRRG